MNKPLELVVYERMDDLELDEWCDGHYRDPDTGDVFAFCYGRAGRLTDAELAAEHHAAVLAVYRARVHHDDADWEKRLGQMQAMYRFATHPHYDDPEETQ